MQGKHININYTSRPPASLFFEADILCAKPSVRPRFMANGIELNKFQSRIEYNR
jgi:hypothetical protein